MDHFGSLSGHLLPYESDLRATLGSLRRHFWHVKATLGVTLESLFEYDGDFVATLGSPGGHFWHLRAALGAFWGRFRKTCGIWG